MATNNLLYQLFGVPSDCTDNELRQAYLRLIRQYHPDLNPHQVQVATVKTQEINVAYEILKDYRQRLDNQNIDFGEKVSPPNFSIELKLSIDDNELVQDIHRRKKAFREAWDALRQEPSDILKALKLIHSAFEVDRRDTVYDLLQNPILIDTASLLISRVESEAACQTIREWTHFLYYEKQRFHEAIQILEDTVATGKATKIIKQILANMHCNFAQGYTSGIEPSPVVSIEHLNRAVELSNQYSDVVYITPDTYAYLAKVYYRIGNNIQALENLKCILNFISDNVNYNANIYKLLGKSYFELGDLTQARSYLEQAQKIDPTLSGVIRLARTLGLTPERGQIPKIQKDATTYKYIEREQVLSVRQIREWAANKNWDDILAFAYSGQTKDTLREIVRSLGKCPDTRAVEHLTSLLSIHTWEIRGVCILSLSKIGNQQTLRELLQLNVFSDGQRDKVRNAVSYLQARITNQVAGSTTDLIKLAKQVFAQKDYGQARFLFERVLQDFERRYKIGLLQPQITSQNLSSQKSSKDANLIRKTFLSGESNQAIQNSIKEIIPKSHQLAFFEVVTLLAYTCEQMEDYREVVSIIRPIFAEAPFKYREQMSKLLRSSLWSSLMFEPYDPIDDEDYLFALNLELDEIARSTVPHDVLYRVRDLARWMYRLGETDAEQWIRLLIRTEAPGTYYVEHVENRNSSHQVELSEYLKEQLTLVNDRIKATIPNKLSQVLKSSGALSDDSYDTTKLLG